MRGAQRTRIRTRPSGRSPVGPHSGIGDGAKDSLIKAWLVAIASGRGATRKLEELFASMIENCTCLYFATFRFGLLADPGRAHPCTFEVQACAGAFRGMCRWLEDVDPPEMPETAQENTGFPTPRPSRGSGRCHPPEESLEEGRCGGLGTRACAPSRHPVGRPCCE